MADEGVLKEEPKVSCTVDEIAGGLIDLLDGDTILNRIDLAKGLSLSPNRVSELVRMGVLQPVSLDPLRFSLEYRRACYGDYKWWLKHKEDGESYAD